MYRAEELLAGLIQCELPPLEEKRSADNLDDRVDDALKGASELTKILEGDESKLSSSQRAELVLHTLDFASRLVGK